MSSKASLKYSTKSYRKNRELDVDSIKSDETKKSRNMRNKKEIK